MGFKIAIDGPAGAGKSTIAKRVAKELSFIYVDTGALYRAMALYFIRKQIAADNKEALAAACREIRVSIRYQAGEQHVYLDEEDVTALLRTEEVGNMASVGATIPEVRQRLLQQQRELAEASDVIMDGRDIGTHVLPDAEVKIYLTASVEARAARRYQEMTGKGETCTLEEITADISARDYRDMNRETVPLKRADDAVLVDTSDMGIEEAVAAISGIVREKREASVLK